MNMEIYPIEMGICHAGNGSFLDTESAIESPNDVWEKPGLVAQRYGSKCSISQNIHGTILFMRLVMMGLLDNVLVHMIHLSC
jgi:hypothetical protein